MERCSAANLLFVQPYIFSTRSSVVQRQSTMTYTRQLSKSHRAELKLYIYIYIYPWTLVAGGQDALHHLRPT